MLDTIALMLSEDMFTIVDHNRFTPSTIGLYKSPYYTLGGRGSMSCIQNPKVSELKNGIYKPRLTVTKRITRGGFETVLRVEFSAPKLLFGNNFDEVSEDHFHPIISILKERLKEMGVWVFSHTLTNAFVSTIHYSKNIILTDRSTPHSIIQELKKANYSQRLDTNQTDYRNEGHSFKFRTNTFEVALYDKLKDLRQAKISEKRAIEPDNAIQLNLFERNKFLEPFEVLRLEVRLNSRPKIRQVFESLGIEIKPTFSEVFNKSISKKVLGKNWSDIEASYKLLEYKPRNNRDLLIQLLSHNPFLTPKKVIQFLGLKVALEDIGIRDFRQITERGNKSKANSWYKLHKEAKELTWPQSYYTPLRPIREAIEQFNPISLKEYERQVYNGIKS